MPLGRWLRAALAGGVIAALAGAAPAGAQTTTTVAPPTPELVPVSPGPLGYFQYTAGPGQSVQGSVRVSNPGTAPATFDLFPADGTTSQATGVVYSEMGAPLAATGRWIHVDASPLSLGPGQSRTVRFEVTVPAGSYRGNHVGAVVAENPDASSERGGAGAGAGVALKVNTRVVVAVVVTVPGPAAVALQLGHPAISAQNGTEQVVTIPMDDTGGLLFKPHLDAAVADCTGTTVTSIHRQLDTFVPHTSIGYQWSLAPLILAAGCYRLTATVTNGSTTLSTVSGPVTVTRTVASVNPAGPGPSRSTPGKVHTTGSSALVVGVIAGAGGALVLVLIIVGLLLLFLRRRDRKEERDGRTA